MPNCEFPGSLKFVCNPKQYGARPPVGRSVLCKLGVAQHAHSQLSRCLLTVERHLLCIFVLFRVVLLFKMNSKHGHVLLAREVCDVFYRENMCVR